MVLQILKWLKPPFHIRQLWDKNVHPHVINPTAALTFLLVTCMYLKEEFDRSAEGAPRSCLFQTIGGGFTRLGLVLLSKFFFVEMCLPRKNQHDNGTTTI